MHLKRTPEAAENAAKTHTWDVVTCDRVKKQNRLASKKVLYVFQPEWDQYYAVSAVLLTGPPYRLAARPRAVKVGLI